MDTQKNKTFPPPLTPERLTELGVWQHGVVPTAKAQFSDEVRSLCESNSCGSYGTSWACPPGIGTVEECRENCLAYENMLVFSGRYELEDSFDFEGMMTAGQEFKKMCDRLYAEVKAAGADFLLLANGKCTRCSKCTYPDAPCRFPEQMYPAMEGCGILVSDVAAKAGVNYINGANTVTYIGGILWNKK